MHNRGATAQSQKPRQKAKPVPRSEEKQEELPGSVVCRAVDLATASAEALSAACDGTERIIWCASGFDDDGNSIDIQGMEKLPALYKSKSSSRGIRPTRFWLESARGCFLQ